MRKIFIDLDGVCADFERGFLDMFGVRHDSMSDKDMWKTIDTHDSFFRSLPVMDESVWGNLQRIDDTYGVDNVIFLTACPHTNYQKHASAKKRWVREWLGDYHVLPVRGGRNKYLFMHRHGDVLIDDFAKNVIPWREAGGHGILHTDWNSTMQQLRILDGVSVSSW
jgi:5'(3')-deoxyribonucleotidase